MFCQRSPAAPASGARPPPAPKNILHRRHASPGHSTAIRATIRVDSPHGSESNARTSGLPLGYNASMRYRLRTLLIVLALGPPLLAFGWWRYSAWKAERARQEAIDAEKARLEELRELIELTTWQSRT